MHFAIAFAENAKELIREESTALCSEILGRWSLRDRLVGPVQHDAHNRSTTGYAQQGCTSLPFKYFSLIPIYVYLWCFNDGKLTTMCFLSFFNDFKGFLSFFKAHQSLRTCSLTWMRLRRLIWLKGN